MSSPSSSEALLERPQRTRPAKLASLVFSGRSLSPSSAPLSAPAGSSVSPSSLREAVLPLAITSVTLHLLLGSWFGAGVPEAPLRAARPPLENVTPAVLEEVQLLPEEKPAEIIPSPAEAETLLDDPAPAAAIDLPPVAELQPIAAVSAATPVSFGIAVKGPVRVVNDAAFASGAIGGQRRAQPVALDASSERDLLLPTLPYPARAKRLHLTGTVTLVFETSATGDILNARVIKSSGHALLDQAAETNLKAGRWKGRPGLFSKEYEFRLQ